jgi:hypothetical protein
MSHPLTKSNTDHLEQASIAVTLEYDHPLLNKRLEASATFLLLTFYICKIISVATTVTG